jgi:hypothetical protein
VIARLEQDDRLITAAFIGAAFGRFPDEAMDCDHKRWAIRVAGGRVLERARSTPS